MAGKKSKKIHRRRKSIFKNKGAVNNGAFYIVAILMLLVFAAYFMIGAQLPAQSPPDDTSQVILNTPKADPSKSSLQLYTFSGSTVTPSPAPAPSEPLSPDISIVPDIPIPPCTHYVAKNGSDSNPGTESSPWLTVQKATNTAVAGNTVCVRAGTYNEMVTFPNSGSSGKLITLRNYPGETAIIDGSGIQTGRTGLVRIMGKSYIMVAGLRIQNVMDPDSTMNPSVNNGAGTAIWVSSSGYNPPGSHIYIVSNYLYHTWGMAMILWGTDRNINNNAVDIIADGNTLDDSHYSDNDFAHEGLSIGGYITGFEVRNNIIKNSTHGGIDAKMGAWNGKIHHNICTTTTYSCVYVDGFTDGAGNIDVYNNTVYNMKSRDSNDVSSGFSVASEQGGTVSGIRFFNNVVYNNPGYGLVIPWYSTGIVRDVTISNNTFYNNASGFTGRGGINIQYSSASNIKINNNILSKNANYQIGVQNGGQTTVTNNLIDGPTNIAGSNAITSSPLFTNTAGADFRLQSSSPAIDKGSATGAPATDFDGKARPQGGGFDIGAYEQ